MKTTSIVLFFSLAALTNPTIGGSLVSRWIQEPILHIYTIEGCNKTYKWTFEEHLHEKADLIINHAPPDLHYELAVVSVEVDLKGPLQQLPVYYHFIGRYSVTFLANTITLTIWNCSVADNGEIFVQVNFPGKHPLTSSTFLTVYKEPQWRTPSYILTGQSGLDLSFSINFTNIEMTPPLDNVTVQFLPQNKTYRTDEMVIMSPGTNGDLEIRWNPYDFCDRLRYVGDGSLQNMRFTIPRMTGASVGEYHVLVSYGSIDYKLSHDQKVILSDITLVTTNPVLTSFNTKTTTSIVQRLGEWMADEISFLDSHWDTLPGLRSYTIEGHNQTYEWTFRDQKFEKAEVRMNHASTDTTFEYAIVSDEIDLKGPLQHLTLFHHFYRERYSVTYHSYTLKLTINGCILADKGEISVQVNFPGGKIPLRSSTVLVVYKAPKWKVPHNTIIGSPGRDLSFSLHLDRGESIPSVDRVLVRFCPRKPQTDYNAKMAITGRRGTRVLEIEWEPPEFDKILRYSGDAGLDDLKFVIPNLNEESAGAYHISIMYSELGYMVDHTQEIIMSDMTALITQMLTTTSWASVLTRSGTTFSENGVHSTVYYNSTSSSPTPHIKGCYVGISLTGCILLAVLVVLAVLLQRKCKRNRNPTGQPCEVIPLNS